MKKEELIAYLPYQDPFLFVDEILEVDENSIIGRYTYRKDAFYYKGHFKNYPVTPGVILTETMAQIGVVSLGIYLLSLSKDALPEHIALTGHQVDFFKPVYPGETVVVKAEKIYFRFQKLKCKVTLYNDQDEVVCTGVIAGMIHVASLKKGDENK